MSSIEEGLTVAGEPGTDLGVNSEAGFNAALAAKVSATREPEAAPAERRSAPVAPDADEALAIKLSILGDDEGSTTIASGLEVKDGERERIRQDYEDSLRAVGIDPNEPPASTPADPEKLELAELRADAAETRFWERCLEEGYDRSAEYFAELRRQISPERAEEVAYELLGLDGDTPEDDPRWAELDAFEQAADEHAARAEFQAATAMKEALEQVVSQNTVRDTKAMLNGWRRDQGISAAEARSRITRAERELGVGLVQLAQQYGVEKAEDILRAMDSTLVGQDEAAREYAFKARMLAEPSTSVSEGLEQMTALGYQPVVPRPPIEPRLNQERAVRRAVKKGPTTGEDIRRDVMAQSQKDAEFAEIQRVAGEMAEALRPKPRTPAGF